MLYIKFMLDAIPVISNFLIIESDPTIKALPKYLNKCIFMVGKNEYQNALPNNKFRPNITSTDDAQKHKVLAKFLDITEKNSATSIKNITSISIDPRLISITIIGCRDSTYVASITRSTF